MKDLKRPKMSSNEVIEDMRRRGFRIGYRSLTIGFEKGIYPFIRLMGVGESGRKSFLILRKEYEKWADENIGGYIEEAV